MRWRTNERTNEWTSKRQADVIMINVRFKLISFHFVLRLIATYGMSQLYFSFVYRLFFVCVLVLCVYVSKSQQHKRHERGIMNGERSVANRLMQTHARTNDERELKIKFTKTLIRQWNAWVCALRLFNTNNPSHQTFTSQTTNQSICSLFCSIFVFYNTNIIIYLLLSHVRRSIQICCCAASTEYSVIFAFFVLWFVMVTSYHSFVRSQFRPCSQVCEVFVWPK